jgi:hypothetical protein
MYLCITQHALHIWRTVTKNNKIIIIINTKIIVVKNGKSTNKIINNDGQIYKLYIKKNVIILVSYNHFRCFYIKKLLYHKLFSILNIDVLKWL